VTKLGRILFGIGCGLLVVLIRLKGGYPEGVAYSILLMNVVTPLLDRYTKSRVFGRVKSHA
jgi:electron transport complex protein RnfD